MSDDELAQIIVASVIVVGAIGFFAWVSWRAATGDERGSAVTNAPPRKGSWPFYLVVSALTIAIVCGLAGLAITLRDGDAIGTKALGTVSLIVALAFGANRFLDVRRDDAPRTAWNPTALAAVLTLATIVVIGYGVQSYPNAFPHLKGEALHLALPLGLIVIPGMILARALRTPGPRGQPSSAS